MTSLVAWVAADTHGPSSLNIATDSRISWSTAASSYTWDQSKKVFASATVPLVIAFTGDVLFPALVIPGILDRVDRHVWRTDEASLTGVIHSIRRGWNDYPASEKRAVSLYIAERIGSGMVSKFRLTLMSFAVGDTAEWMIRDIAVPRQSECLAVDGSGARGVGDALLKWEATAVGGTSRAIYSGFVDGIVSGVDQGSGGAPQLGSIYRIGAGRLLGIVHNDQRYFAGSHLIGDESVHGVEWRNSLFERTDGRTKTRMAGAQPQPRPESSA